MAIEIKKCEHCGNEFHGTVRAKYCTMKCRTYANREKARQAKALTMTRDNTKAKIVGFVA